MARSHRARRKKPTESSNAGWIAVFVSVCAGTHSQDWYRRFLATILEAPEVVEVYRMSGEIDYVIKLSVQDLSAYDAFCRKLSARVELKFLKSMFAMELLKQTSGRRTDEPRAGEEAVTPGPPSPAGSVKPRQSRRSSPSGAAT